MKRSSIIAFVVLGVILIVAIGLLSWVVGSRNHFVGLDENVKTQWAQVENQLQRRYDLIPNLVETVKGFATHEKDVFVRVTEARSKVAGAGNIPDKIKANNELSSALARLLVVVERYPEIKSNQNFLALQTELSGTENRLSTERRRYNERVRDYNTAIRLFPGSLIAGFFSFTRAELFEAPEEARPAPKVDFGTGDTD
ncbi:LemA family protein [Candidatus Eisenbacteria bacterium]|uniref:LemA family protein n=1 Tax=Eiseniibacteriota bacterium TaxID=2212470 RepID=A0ABV6YII3_UNCEI